VAAHVDRAADVDRRDHGAGQRRRSRRLPAAAVALALLGGALTAGCGGESGDLMAIEATGGGAGRASFDIVVANDGRGSCNGGAEEKIPSDLVIDAREIERDLGSLAEDGAAYLEGSARGRRELAVRVKAGAVRWTEGAPDLPDVLPRTQLLALQLDRLLCR
jgi:hypothetical protein